MMLVASPAIITSIDFENKNRVTVISQKKVVLYKIANEMLNDKDAMDFIANNEKSPLLKLCKEKGIDLEKPYKLEIGLDKDDFTKLCKTIVVSQ